MTKNALSFINIVVLSLIINLSSTKDVLVTAKSQSNNSLESQVNKETHSVKTSTAEQPCIRYCPGDSESDGGKSIAFLRLGRSGNEAEDDSEKEVRRAIDEAIKPQGSSASHNLTKRSNDAKEEEQSTAEDAATNPEDQEEGESFEDNLDVEASYNPSNEEYDNPTEDKERFEYVPYEDFELISQPEDEDESMFEPFFKPKVLHPSSPGYYDYIEKRNSFSLRPMKKLRPIFPHKKDGIDIFRPTKKNNFAFRPMKKGNFAFRPMKKSNFAFRPMKKSNFEFRPMKRGNFDFRPMKKGNFDFRPMKKTNFDFRPMKRSNFAFRPMRRSNFAFRPMKRSTFDFRPMKRSNFAFRPMKKLSDSFSFRPVKKSFQFRPMKKRGQVSKDSFLRYGKRDSFALRPMKRPEDSFVLRPMKKDADDFDGSFFDHKFFNSYGKRSSFSLRPMKKDMTGFQFRPMKRYVSEDDSFVWNPLNLPAVYENPTE